MQNSRSAPEVDVIQGSVVVFDRRIRRKLSVKRAQSSLDTEPAVRFDQRWIVHRLGGVGSSKNGSPQVL